MSATTSTWAIPFATAGDQLCDGDAIMEAMAERIDTILDGFDTSIDMFSVRAYAQTKVDTVVFDTTVTSTLLNVYDQVLADTNDMVNLSLSPSVITVPATTPGVYVVGTFGSATDTLTVNANTMFMDMQMSATDGYAMFGLQGQAYFQNTSTGANGGQPVAMVATGLTSGLPGSGTSDFQIFSLYEFAGSNTVMTTGPTRLFAIRVSAAF